MDEMELERERDPEEISEAEYNEILGLEGMETAGSSEDGDKGLDEEVSDVEEDVDGDDADGSLRGIRRKKKKRRFGSADEGDLDEARDAGGWSEDPSSPSDDGSLGMTGEGAPVGKEEYFSEDEILAELRQEKEVLEKRLGPECFRRITGEYVTLRAREDGNTSVSVGGSEDSSRSFGMTTEKDSVTMRPEGVEATEERGLHSYQGAVDFVSYAVNAGQTISEMSKDNIRRSDENFYAGQKEIRHYSVPMMEAVAVMGAASMASSIRDDMADLARAALRTADLMDGGRISFDDLSATMSELKARLRDVTPADAKMILRNSETIRDLFLVRSQFLGSAGDGGNPGFSSEGKSAFRDETGGSYSIGLAPEAKANNSFDTGRGRTDQVGGLSEELLEHVRSKDFIDLREEKTNEVLKFCCKRSRNDVMREVNPAGMSNAQLKRLLKQGKKKDLSEADMAVLRLLLRQRKMREARQKVKVFQNIKRYASLAARRITEADDNVVAGVMASQRVAIAAAGISGTVRFAIRAGVFTHRVWTRYGLVGKHVGAGERYVVRKAADGTRYVLRKTGDGIRAVKVATKNAVVKTKPVQVARESARIAKEAISNAESVKRIKEAGKAARKAQRTVAAHTAKMAFAASKVQEGVRIVFTPVRVLKKAVGKVFAFFSGLKAAIAGAFFGIIVVYAVLVILITGLLTIFTIEGEAVMNVMLCNDEKYVPDTVGLLDVFFTEEKDEAMRIATGAPQNPEVFFGHKISRYGAPLADGSWTDGYKIYYRDMDGNIIENGVNNIKDVVVLAYVMMDGDFDTDPVARDALIRDLLAVLNPGVTWEETAVYTAEVGDDSYGYSCDSSADYDEMDAMKAAGVRFFGSVVSYSGDGCEGDEDDRYCSGHEVDVCYGHKDIKVFITVGFMEDVFEGKVSVGMLGMPGDGSEDPSSPSSDGSVGMTGGKPYQKYLQAFLERGGWTEDAREWANALYAADWFDLYGSDPAGGVGFSVADTLSAEEIASLSEQYGSIDGTRSAVSTFAMEMVGKIPYYWGGKPSSGDYDDNHFYTDVKSDGSQYKRTKKGLDCSGFVAFVYWHVLGHPIGASSTGDFTNGRYRKVSAENLKPGDVGLLRTGYSNGSSVNHIGIFVGRDGSGSAIWVHCTGGKTSKVVCGGYNFSVYYSILE